MSKKVERVVLITTIKLYSAIRTNGWIAKVCLSVPVIARSKLKQFRQMAIDIGKGNIGFVLHLVCDMTKE